MVKSLLNRLKTGFVTAATFLVTSYSHAEIENLDFQDVRNSMQIARQVAPTYQIKQTGGEIPTGSRTNNFLFREKTDGIFEISHFIYWNNRSGVDSILKEPERLRPGQCELYIGVPEGVKISTEKQRVAFPLDRELRDTYLKSAEETESAQEIRSEWEKAMGMKVFLTDLAGKMLRESEEKQTREKIERYFDGKKEPERIDFWPVDQDILNVEGYRELCRTITIGLETEGFTERRIPITIYGKTVSENGGSGTANSTLLRTTGEWVSNFSVANPNFGENTFPDLDSFLGFHKLETGEGMEKSYILFEVDKVAGKHVVRTGLFNEHGSEDGFFILDQDRDKIKIWGGDLSKLEEIIRTFGSLETALESPELFEDAPEYLTHEKLSEEEYEKIKEEHKTKEEQRIFRLKRRPSSADTIPWNNYLNN